MCIAHHAEENCMKNASMGETIRQIFSERIRIFMSDKQNYRRAIRTVIRSSCFGELSKLYADRKKALFAALRRRGMSDRLADALYGILRANNWGLDFDALLAGLSDCQDGFYFDYSELYMTGSCILLLLAVELAGKKDSDALAGLLRNARRTAAMLESLDTEELLRRVSYMESLLLTLEDFRRSDEQSRQQYRDNLTAYARYAGISEIEAAQRMYDRASGPLPCRFERMVSAARNLFFPLWTGLVLLGEFCTALFLGPLEALLALLPMTSAVRLLLDFLFARVIPAKPLLKLAPSALGADEGTLIVVTSLLFGEEKDAALFERLENFYLLSRSAPDCPLYFGIAGDYRDAAEASVPGDDAIFQHACRQIQRLNEKYGPHFCLFIRPRSYTPGEKRFMGWERKRGAILELLHYLRGKNSSVLAYTPDGERLPHLRYLLTLDADTNLSMNAVLHMIGAMAHPSNRPVIENGRVVAGYGVMQPRMECSLSSFYGTLFSRISAGSGGYSLYASAAYETYQTLFEEGIFCGKGILDIDAADALLTDRFPEGRILSHDILEGGVLRAALLSDISLTDSTPATPGAWYDRQHRWIRGDVQALPYARPPLNALSRFKLWDNLRRALVPIAAFAGLLLSRFAAHPAVYAVLLLSDVLFPLPALFLPPHRWLLRKCRPALMSPLPGTLARLFWEVCALPYTACVHADAVLRALWRMLFSGRGLMEWKTSTESASSKRSGMGYYYLRMWICPAAGLAMLLFGAPALRFIGLLWGIFPLLCALSERRYTEEPAVLSPERQKRLHGWAADMWRFFAHTVTAEENDLPPDNIQLSPNTAIAHRTSPTNIGLYLLSCLGAADLGLIDASELKERLSATLSSVVRLQKWNGHLYNWYDTRSCEVLGGGFVSTVDSGNFIVCLLTLRAGLPAYIQDPALSGMLDDLIAEADFRYLLHPQRRMLSVGYDPRAGRLSDACYDHFISEARTICYYAAASGQIPDGESLWRRLKRPLVCRRGRLGVASWTGTMFEYFMPAIFLPHKTGSLGAQALSYAFGRQRAAGAESVWGRSESCYYAFDLEMNYQYHAFGCAALAIKDGMNTENVFAPYASFLLLNCGAPESVFANLEAFESRGMYGKYGFYEAMDCCRRRVGSGFALIRTYMSHHIGMSLLSVVNCLCGGVMQKRFMQEPCCRAAHELLEERVPVHAVAPAVLEHRRPEVQTPIPTLLSADFPAGQASLLSNHRLSLLVSARGVMTLFDGKTALTRPTLGEEQRGMRMLLQCGDACIALGGEEFTARPDAVTLRNALPDGDAELTLTMDPYESCLCLHIRARCAAETICPMLCFEPVLSAPKSYYAHPVFSDLFIEALYDEDYHILLFRRRPRSSPAEECWLGAAMLSGSGSYAFLTQRDALLPLNYGVEELKALCGMSFAGHSHTGACVIPFCAMKKASEIGAGGRYACDFLLASGKSRREVCTLIRNAAKRGEKSREPLSDVMRMRLLPVARNLRALAAVSDEDVRCADRLMTACLRGGFLPHRRQRDLTRMWALGISGDRILVVLDLRAGAFTRDGNLRPFSENLVSLFIRMYRYHLLSSFRYDLILLCHDIDAYANPRKAALRELVTRCGSALMLDADGGIHILDGPRPLWRDCAEYYSVLDQDSLPEKMLDANSVQNDTVVRRLRGGDAGYAFLPNAFSFRRAAFPTRPPWSYIYANRIFGCLLSENSLGFAWMLNSRLNRLNVMENDVMQSDGLQLLLYRDEKCYDLCALAREVFYRRGYGEFRGEADGVSYRIRAGVDRRLPVMLICVELGGDGRLSLVYREDQQACILREPESGVYLLFPDISLPLTDAICGKFGGRADVEAEFAACERENAGQFSAIELHSGIPALDEMMNYYLPWQALVCRIRARTGFFQPGGAYGFRDQLQDMLSMLHFDPHTVRTHLLRCAAHQYTEGDVMHWWHGGRHSRGVRTRCSDDYLWLPYVACAYLRITGDETVLDAPLPYLESEPLRESEQDRYEQPVRSPRERWETLYAHCIRAIEHGLRFGAHGLPLMGNGDWNDGMNAVGKDGRGESVWLAFFLRMVLRDFAPVAEARGDGRLASRYRAFEKKLHDAIEEHAWDGGHYLRAFFDDGTPLGGDACSECRIDALPQAFAAIVDGRTPRSVQAVREAYARLYDQDTRIYRLLAPAFDNGPDNPGYIKGYIPGLRENGGQYTHAAIWAAWGLLCAGETDRAAEVLLSINPALRCEDESLRQRYRLEPYALAGDVYFAPGHEGRGGWSLYTGAASWYYRILLEQVLGYRREGNSFSLHPRLSRRIPEFSLTLRFGGGEYRINARLDTEEQLWLDGEICENRFVFDGKTHEITLHQKNLPESLEKKQNMV